MPYGLSKAIGGDTPANDQKMERCVADVMAKGAPKLQAILTCKSSLQKAKKKGGSK